MPRDVIVLFWYPTDPFSTNAWWNMAPWIQGYATHTAALAALASDRASHTCACLIVPADRTVWAYDDRGTCCGQIEGNWPLQGRFNRFFDDIEGNWWES